MKLPLFFGRLIFGIARFINRFLPILNTPRTRIAVILNEREILLVKNWMGRQQWTLPGGGVKRGEKPASAAARELREETGLIVDPADLIFLGQIKDAAFPRAVLVYRIGVSDSDSAVSIPNSARHEITDLSWHPLNSLPMDRLNLVDRALATQQQG